MKEISEENKIGELYGHSVYIYIGDEYSVSAKRHDKELAAKFLQESFKNKGFVDMLKSIFSPLKD